MPEPAEAPAAFADNFDAVIRHNEAQIAAEEAAAKQQPEQSQSIGDDAGGEEGDDIWSDDTDVEGDTEDDGETEPDEETESDGEEGEGELLHGLKQAEILEALKKGEMPAELAKQIKVTTKVNGEDLPVSIEEAARGYQRLSDYTRNKRETSRLRQEAQQTLDNVNQMFTAWKSPQQLRDGLRRLGLWDSFHEVAQQYAVEQFREMQLKEQNPELYEMRQELKREREAREALEAKLNRPTDNRADREARAEEYARELQPKIFAAFETVGIKDPLISKDGKEVPNVAARKAFKDAFQELYDPDADIEDVIRDAAQATAEHLSDLAKRHAANEGKGKPKPPPTGAGKPAAAGRPAPSRRATPQRMTVDQFDAWAQKNPRLR